tara:strand:+ start:338 stop:661 length:324 start_codon:yes stop_codon:yes gene_type:complete
MSVTKLMPWLIPISQIPRKRILTDQELKVLAPAFKELVIVARGIEHSGVPRTELSSFGLLLMRLPPIVQKVIRRQKLSRDDVEQLRTLSAIFHAEDRLEEAKRVGSG